MAVQPRSASLGEDGGGDPPPPNHLGPQPLAQGRRNFRATEAEEGVGAYAGL
jgi:hypothetical protein